MTDEARKARNAYMNEWRRKNPEKVKANTARFWERKAAKAEAAKATGEANNNG